MLSKRCRGRLLLPMVGGMVGWRIRVMMIPIPFSMLRREETWDLSQSVDAA